MRLRVQGERRTEGDRLLRTLDAAELASWDADFASGGVTGLPGGYFGTSSIPNLAVAVGKDGYVYLLNRDNLGGIAAEGEAEHVVQRLGPYGGVWSRPGVWPGEGGWVYIPTASDGETAGGSSGYLRVYKYGVSGEGKPTLSLDASVQGSVWLLLQRAGNHLPRHGRRVGARVAGVGAQRQRRRRPAAGV